jgi:hypothetical protein
MAKTTVFIEGQTNGNRKLCNHIAGLANCFVEQTTARNGIALLFPTKREAKKAIWEAYIELRRDPDNKEILSYSKFGALRYDASSAEIK